MVATRRVRRGELRVRRRGFPSRRIGQGTGKESVEGEEEKGTSREGEEFLSKAARIEEEVRIDFPV